jgi:hypothetical protein
VIQWTQEVFGRTLSNVCVAQPVIPLTQGSVPIAVGAGTTQLVAGLAGERIYVTALSVTGTGNVQFVAGTGASCSSPTPLTGNLALTGQVVVVGGGSGVVLVGPVAATVCVVASAAMNGSLAYAQF